MNIKIIEGFPQQKESSLSLMNPWMMKHHLFIEFFEGVNGESVTEFIQDTEEAKELAQELLDAYIKLMQWAEKRE